MIKEEKLLEKLNASSVYGSFGTPISSDEIKDYLDSATPSNNKRCILAESTKKFLNEIDNYDLERVKIKMNSDKNKTCLIIRCMSNKNYCMINTIKFKNVNTGDIITIDRDRTEYTSIELPDSFNSYKYSIHMLWIDCYIWDGVSKNYDIDFSDLEFVEFEIDEEADVDYKLELMEYESAPHINS